MKQTIEYYYSLKIEDLYIENDSYHFVIDKEDYYFVFCNRDKKELDDLIECSKELKSRGIDCHDIILNIKNEILTPVDDVNYILLKVRNKNEIISITDMIQINKKLIISNDNQSLYRNDWAKLWSSKVDYIEEQLSQIKVDNIINSSVNYYIGLCENAIYYVNTINDKYKPSHLDVITLSHKRILYPNIKLNYLNPLSFIFDLEVRDIAEYVKSTFFSENDALLELTTYLKSKKLTIYSYNMLFARLLYPSYYFDVYEQIINKNKSSENLLKIIKNFQE